MSVVLITGANRGLGLECVKQLAEAHPQWTIYLTARHQQDAQQALKELKENNTSKRCDYHNVIPHQLDVTDEASIDAALMSIRERSGHVDYVIANAGLGQSSDMNTSSSVFDVNVFGTSRLIERIEPLCSSNATIIVVASEFGPWTQYQCNETLQQVLNNADMSLSEWRYLAHDYLMYVKSDHHHVSRYSWPHPQHTAFSYGVSKCLIGLFVRIFARLYDRHIVAVCPGWCRTRMTNHSGLRDVSQGARSILWPIHHRQTSARLYQDGRARPWQYMQPAEWLQI